MTTYQQALAKATSTTSWAVAMCDNFVAEMWGFPASGYNTAVDNWTASPQKHPGDYNAPAGALMYWGGGDGHVALSTGDGNIISTDIGGAGTVTKVPASQITRVWGKPYLGWAAPYFGGQSAGTLGPYTGQATTTTDSGGSTYQSDGGAATATGFLDGALKPFAGLIKSVIWMVEITIGGIIMVVAALAIAKEAV